MQPIPFPLAHLASFHFQLRLFGSERSTYSYRNFSCGRDRWQYWNCPFYKHDAIITPLNILFG
jgi:hypothetical protein